MPRAIDMPASHPQRRTVASIALSTLSILVIGVHAEDQQAPTSETSIGIFYQSDAPARTELWRHGDQGEQLALRGRVMGPGGAPVHDARVELWQADGAGWVREDRYRTTLRTKPDGSFAVRTAYPGYIAGASGIWGARHIHVVVTHPEYLRLVSLILFKGDPHLAEDLYPELAIFVEEGRIEQESVRFGEVDIVLRRR